MMDIVFDVEKIEETDEKWRSLTLWKNETKEIPNKTLNNMVVALCHRDPLAGTFAYNEFSHEIIVLKCPPWENVDAFTPRRIQDSDITSLIVILERLNYSPTYDLLSKAIEVAALKNKIHPARDYFNALQWDEVPRLDNWLTYYCGCEQDPSDYLASVGSKFLIAGVSRIFEPACKFDHMLILEGNQRAGKSSALEILATINGVSYFSDAVTIDKIDDKDTILKLQGRLIIEFAELTGFAKKETDAIKRWITVKTDEGRLPYGRHLKIFPRQFILAGTNNPFQGWMNDPTGSRRFWPVTVGKKIDLTSLRRDAPMLWAESVHRYKNKEPIHLSDDMELRADEVRKTRQVVDAWEDFINAEFGAMRSVTSDEIFIALKIERNKQDWHSSRRVASIMRKLGYEYIKTNKWKWTKENNNKDTEENMLI